MLPLQWGNQEGVTQRHQCCSKTSAKKRCDFRHTFRQTINLQIMNEDELFQQNGFEPLTSMTIAWCSNHWAIVKKVGKGLQQMSAHGIRPIALGSNFPSPFFLRHLGLTCSVALTTRCSRIKHCGTCVTSMHRNLSVTGFCHTHLHLFPDFRVLVLFFSNVTPPFNHPLYLAIDLCARYPIWRGVANLVR